MIDRFMVDTVERAGYSRRMTQPKQYRTTVHNGSIHLVVRLQFEKVDTIAYVAPIRGVKYDKKTGAIVQVQYGAVFSLRNPKIDEGQLQLREVRAQFERERHELATELHARGITSTDYRNLRFLGIDPMKATPADVAAVREMAAEMEKSMAKYENLIRKANQKELA